MKIAICAGVLLTTVVAAQSPTGPTVQDAVTRHHLRQYQLMKDMTQVMTAMTEQMSRGDVTDEQRKQMAQRMSMMSNLMRRMSGLEARHAMKEVEWERQMNAMRRQMDDMMREPIAKPATQ